MGHDSRDPFTGRMTTGHEWNGIEELDTPVPRIVLFFLAVTTLFSIGYWLLMPAWPLGWSYTKGALGIDQRQVVMQQVDEANAARAAWTDKVAALDYDAILADSELMRSVSETGRTLFGDNCAVCHGTSGSGGPGFPNLAAGSWLWGGDPETIAETIRVGINSTHDETRVSQMLAFGKDDMLNREQVRDVVAYVQSLSSNDEAKPGDPARIAAGQEVFAANCAACHGENAAGSHDVGAPDLTDANWIYGGDAQSIANSVHSGRQGHMPHWGGRLSPVDIKILTLYVHQLAGAGE